MKTLIILILIVSIFSCSNNNLADNAGDIAPETTFEEEIQTDEIAAVMSTSKQGDSRSLPDVKESINQNHKIIKDGKIGIRVIEIENLKKQIDSLVKFYKAYYASENLINSEYGISYELKIRVPSDQLERFVLKLESGQGEVLYKEIKAHDITEEFIDLEARLKNKRNYLIRYNELLKRANSIKEILEIQEKSRIIEEEIESSEGRLRYLSNLVDLSTLDLTITEVKDFKYAPVNRDKFIEKFKQSISKGWFGFIDFLLFIIKLWPFCIVLGLLSFIWFKIRKAKSKK